MVSSNVLKKYHHLEGKPHWRRTIAVYIALDKAPDDYSYSQLMEWVKQETGKGCSRKLISKWKCQSSVTCTEQSRSISHQSSVESQSSIINAQKEPLEELPIIVEYEPLLTNQTEGKDQRPLTKSVSKWVKKVRNIIGLTTALLITNFSLTPQDSTVKLAVAESPTPLTISNFEYEPKPKSVEPNRIKINVTITDPSDLKVKPGDEVVKGQIISDRTTERQRLLNQRKQLELSLKKLTIPIPNIQAPSSIAKLPNLPPISLSHEQATINLKEQQLNEAVQAVSNQQEKINSLNHLSGVSHRSSDVSHQSSVRNKPSTINHNQRSVKPHKVNPSTKIPNSKFNFVDAKGNPLNQNQETLTINVNKSRDIQLSNQSQTTETINNNFSTQLPSSTIPFNQPLQSSKSNNQPTNYNNKLKAIIEHETVILNQLKAKQEKANRELQVAKSQLETAKEQRRYAEHQLYLENNRRAIALQQQSLELERQRTIRAGQLQEQEYSKTQISAKLIEIDNAINQLSTVKIPYNGTVKKVKWNGQTDHTLNVTVTLDVDEPSVSQESNN
ncbi:MAG: hypothetical protein AB4060_06085 [Crocosphaera sp.]